jgi:hypothetical protein
MDVNEIDPIGLKTLETALDRIHIALDGGPWAEVTVWQAELGRDEHLVALALHGLAESILGPGFAVVGRGVEIVDSPIDCLPGDLKGLSSACTRTGAHRNVGHEGFGSAQSAISRDSRAGPLVASDIGHIGRADREDVLDRHRPPTTIGNDRGGEGGGESPACAS